MIDWQISTRYPFLSWQGTDELLIRKSKGSPLILKPHMYNIRAHINAQLSTCLDVFATKIGFHFLPCVTLCHLARPSKRLARWGLAVLARAAIVLSLVSCLGNSLLQLQSHFLRQCSRTLRTFSVAFLRECNALNCFDTPRWLLIHWSSSAFESRFFYSGLVEIFLPSFPLWYVGQSLCFSCRLWRFWVVEVPNSLRRSQGQMTFESTKTE